MFGGNVQEERVRKRAAIVIQCAYRCRLARIAIQDRYRSQYRKIYDSDAKHYIYQNKKNLDIDLKLPEYFKRSSLPSPRDLDAPLSYNPGNELNNDGCALVITNVIFPLGKWASSQLPSELEHDHDQIVDLLTHEYIGRMRNENVLSLKNPTSEDVKDAFKQLRKLCRSNGFAFIYITTHIITISKSDKENKKENCYFAFKNSLWDPMKNTELVESTISLTDLSKLINKVSCKFKTIFLNYAHHSPPRKVLIPSSKLLYPPSNCLQRLSDLTTCPVIGCCSLGFNLREYLKYHPGIQYNLQNRESQDIKKKNSEEKTSTEIAVIGDKKVDPSTAIASNSSSSSSVYDSNLWKKLLKDFEIPAIKEITKSTKPTKPGPTWKQNGTTFNLVEVDMPSQDERKNYERRLLFWRIRRTLAKPVNVMKQLHIMYKKYSLSSPEQTSIIFKGNSIFGRSFIRALNGGASKPDDLYIRLSTLFPFIYNSMKVSIEKLNSQSTNTGNMKVSGGDDKDDGNGSITSLTSVAKAHYQQSPVLFVPKLTSSLTTLHPTITKENRFDYFLSFPCLYRCAPPPAPEKPFINEVKDDSVSLEWFNPSFQGILPFKYKIFIKNNTRNYRKWLELAYPGEIRKTTFMIRNLPMGVSCEFRLSAYNNGGWSEQSEETDTVIPGEDRTFVLPKRIKWKRLQQSGLLGILDYLQLYDYSSEDQDHGLKIIFSLIQSYDSHYQTLSYKLLIRILDRIFFNLKRFPSYSAIITNSFLIIGFIMNHQKYDRKIRYYCVNNGLVSIIHEMKEKYFSSSSVMNAIQWIGKSEFKKYLTNPNAVLHEEKEGGRRESKEKGRKSDVDKQQPRNIKQEMQKMEQDKVVGETKERKYLLNYSIPGKYEVLFPPDGSDDDNDDDSDEGEDSDEAGDEENEGRKEERKNEETKGKRSPRPLSGGNNRKVFIAPKSVTVSAKN
jgi:hypothetical protein